MNFELTEDQRLLVETIATFAKKQSPVVRMRELRDDALGWSPAVWRQMGDLGWLGAAFPESVGGGGGSFVDACLVLEHLGTTLVPEPFLSSLVAGIAVLDAGDDRQRESVLAPVLAGRSSIALAWAEPDSRHDPAAITTRADRHGAGYRLHGCKRFVQDGHGAAQLVVSARSASGISLFVVDAKMPGLDMQTVRTMDGRKAAMIDLAGVEVGPERLLGSEGAGLAALERALDAGAAGACAEGVGIMRAVLAMTIAYLREREQFGVKIGSFQVLQHRAVDMFIESELARSSALAAGIRLDDPEPVERAAAVSAALVQLVESGRFVTRQAIQLHGGIGITDEHDIGLYFKRMQVLGTLFGDEEHHVARFAHLPSFDR